MLLATVVGAGAWLRIARLHEQDVDSAPAGAVTQPASPVPASISAGGGKQPGSSSEEWTIEEASGERNPVNGGRPLSSAERDRRYRELLSAPPPPPPAKTAGQPSMLDRMIAPITDALGGGKPKPAPAPVTAPPRPPAPAPNRSEPARPKPGAPAEEPKPSALEQDEETDIQPPQLITAEFNPREIRDEEETQFIATIFDNLSGVRSASGVVASPSGSVTSFSAVREGYGNRFVARIKVPKDAPEGVWAVRYVTLTDNATNSVHLNQAQGAVPATAQFRVVSASSDASGPKLLSVRLERFAMRAGERNMVFVTAEDDKAGVLTASGLFVSPAKAARIGFGCKEGTAGTWECSITAPACIDCGLWRLDQIQLQDKAGNTATFRGENPAVAGVTVDIAGDQCDSVAPSIVMVSVEPVAVSNAQANSIQVKAVVEDQGPCGVASVSGQAVPPGGVGGQRHPIVFKPTGDGRTYLGTLNLQQAAVRGQWTLSWMQVLDRGHNLRAYSGTDPTISKATFRVD